MSLKFVLPSCLSAPNLFSGDQPVEGRASCAADFGLSPGEKSEQEYLATLSAQYKVEHYEDCYDLIGWLKMNVPLDGDGCVH